MRKLAFLILLSAAFIVSANAQPSNKDFLGRWDITVTAPDHEYPSWIEISDSGGSLSAQFVGRWGNARPLPKVSITDGKFTFVSPKDEEDAQSDMVYEGKLTGEKLTGTVNAPHGGTWKWTAQRAPQLKAKNTSPKWGRPIELFNQKDLAGWTMSDPKSNNPWKVVNGILVSPTHGPEIVNDRKFKDFKLHVEFNCADNSNSGVYLRGRYEVQVETNSIQEPPSHHMGSIYGFIAPHPELARTPGVWQSYDITLIGRTVTVAQNGKTIIDHQEIPGITGGALDSHEELPGPIYLQGSEDGHVSYRKIVLTPAEE